MGPIASLYILENYRRSSKISFVNHFKEVKTLYEQMRAKSYLIVKMHHVHDEKINYKSNNLHIRSGKEANLLETENVDE